MPRASSWRPVSRTFGSPCDRDVPFFGRVVDHEGKPVAGADVRARVHRDAHGPGRRRSPRIFEVAAMGSSRSAPITTVDSRSRACRTAISPRLRPGSSKKLCSETWPRITSSIIRDGRSSSWRDASMADAAIDVTLQEAFRGKVNPQPFRLKSRPAGWFQFDIKRQVILAKLRDRQKSRTSARPTT